ncbi:MAG TPA: hypothetical protein VKA42_04560 [Acidimicrobiales bacterium]|nr:hypothetical protein [Acidimicrobiales bacterium]
MALAGGGDDGQGAGDPPATTAEPATTATTAIAGTGASTATTGVDLGGLGSLGGLGGGGGSGGGDAEPNDRCRAPTGTPRPGPRSWTLAPTSWPRPAAGMIPDPSGTCGCVYDEVAAGDVGFAEFNHQWVLVDADPNSAAVQALNDASMSCMLSAVG